MLSKRFKFTANTAAPTPDVVGRSFVLGRPGRRGGFHIFLGNQLWDIDPGAYQSGDRVVVTSVNNYKLVVLCTPYNSNSQEGSRHLTI
jgi:membrane protein implicated in regulation of membrane protease activity